MRCYHTKVCCDFPPPLSRFWYCHVPGNLIFKDGSGEAALLPEPMMVEKNHPEVANDTGSRNKHLRIFIPHILRLGSLGTLWSGLIVIVMGPPCDCDCDWDQIGLKLRFWDWAPCDLVGLDSSASVFFNFDFYFLNIFSFFEIETGAPCGLVGLDFSASVSASRAPGRRGAEKWALERIQG